MLMLKLIPLFAKNIQKNYNLQKLNKKFVVEKVKNSPDYKN